MTTDLGPVRATSETKKTFLLHPFKQVAGLWTQFYSLDPFFYGRRSFEVLTPGRVRTLDLFLM